MLPIKRDKVDLSKSSPEDQRLFAKYGKNPVHRALNLKKDRKFFDSGDYALSKAGCAPQSTVGTAIPNPENIPHASSSGNSHNNGQKPNPISPTNSTNPVNKESALANDENTTVPEYEQLSNLPLKRDKVDPSKLSPENQRLFALYGKIPAHKRLMGMQGGRKYFDSGDYALSKAGCAPQSTVGTAIPNPENIPHALSSGNSHNNGQKPISISPTNSTSPVNKESGLANDENTIPEYEQLGEETVIDKTTETTEAETIG